MNDSVPHFVVTTKDMPGGFDLTRFHRVGHPLRTELHTVAAESAFTPVSKNKPHTLTDLSTDFAFFTTGVIHATTPFDRDPVSEFNRQYPPKTSDQLPLVIDHTLPFFSGLGVCLSAGLPVNYNCRVYAIPHERLNDLVSVIAGIAMIDRKNGFYAKINFYQIDIVDEFALQQMTVADKLPFVPLTVFGVSSNKGFSYLQPGKYPQLPYLVTESPTPDVLHEARNVLVEG